MNGPAWAFLASQRSIDIVRLGGAAPGASPGVPLRVAYLAAADPAGHRDSAAYKRVPMTLLRSERPLYAPAGVTVVRLPGGRRAVQISYAAPSPLSLLG